MAELLLVGVGGAFGSLLRYVLGKFIAARTEEHKIVFPVSTFLINITGAFLLGILSSIDVQNNIYLLLGDGFLGAYTTFSTFMYEGMKLFEKNEKLNAAVYIVGSLFVGITGYIAGYFIMSH